MSNYHIGGLSGTGKTTLRAEFEKRGYRAIEADEHLAAYIDPATGEKTTEKSTLNWMWVKDKVEELLGTETGKPVFVCGGSMNQLDFKHHFKKMFTLYLDDDTLRHRIMTRTNNDAGKDPAGLALQLEWNKGTAQYAKEKGTILIDASQPIEAVADEILSYVAEDKQIGA